MRHKLIHIALLTIACLAPVAHGDGPVAEPTKHDLDALRSLNVPTDNAGLLQYLSMLRPGEDTKQLVQGLIQEMGADKFDDRDRATEKLKALGWAAVPLLQDATGHQDLEIAERAKEVLAYVNRPNSSNHRIFTAAMRILAARKPRGATPIIVQLGSLCREYDQFVAIDQAIEGCVREQDQAALLDLTQHPEELVRAMAIHALGQSLPREQATAPGVRGPLKQPIQANILALLREGLTDKSDFVRFSAVRNIVEVEPRTCLLPLLELLNAENGRVRRTAASLLRSLTGQHFGYSAVANAEARGEATDRWRHWVEQNGAKATLQIKKPARDVIGRWIVCLPYKRVIELDGAGKQVFESKAVTSATDAAGLPNGNRVFCDWNSKSLIELDRGGKEVWRKPLPGTPNGLHRLSNGNTLVALFNERQLIEMNPEGKITWKATVPGRPSSISRLENGRFLVSMHSVNQVAEVDDKGEVKWKATATAPESARRLANGNTLAASGTGKVLEINPQGKTVWSLNINRPYDAVRLNNGNTLVGTQTGLYEMSPDGKQVRHHNLGYVRRISPY